MYSGVSTCDCGDYLQSLPSRDNNSEESQLLSGVRDGADRDVEDKESKKQEKTRMKAENDFQTIRVPGSGAAVRTFGVCELKLALFVHVHGVTEYVQIHL